MAYETIEQAPVLGDFTLLSEHQVRTPGTFFGGKPVLHLHSSESKLRITAADLASQPDFASLEAGDGNRVEGDVVEIPDLEIWVNSRNLTLYSSANSAGLQIFYPTISIHAQDGDAVLLELNLSDSNTADEDLVFLQVRIVPVKIAHDDATAAAAVPLEQIADTENLPNGHQQQPQQNGSAASAVEQLYNAISACQELNPDPASDDEGQGAGFDPTAPGATGWITSENMQHFVDENGDFRVPDGVAVVGDEEGGESLGQGAGRRRTAEEVGGEEEVGDEEAKWQRTG